MGILSIQSLAIAIVYICSIQSCRLLYNLGHPPPNYLNGAGRIQIFLTKKFYVKIEIDRLKFK